MGFNFSDTKGTIGLAALTGLSYLVARDMGGVPAEIVTSVFDGLSALSYTANVPALGHMFDYTSMTACEQFAKLALCGIPLTIGKGVYDSIK